MRRFNLLLTLLLVFAFSATVITAQVKDPRKGQGKPKIGASGTGSSGTTTGSGGKEAGQKKIKIGATGAAVTEPTEIVKLPPPPPPNLSSLAIATNAPNAQVIVNGTKKYKTDANGAVPTPLVLNPGPTTIKVVHPDFDEKEEKVTLIKGKPVLETINLISKYGDLVIGGLPAGAQIFIDDVEKTAEAILDEEQKQVTLKRVARGERNIKILHPDYVEFAEKIEIKPGEALPYTPALELALSYLTVKSLEGATVYLNGEEKGKVLPEGSLAVNGVKPGTYEISILKDGYLEWKKKDLKLEIGPKTLEVKLDPRPNSEQFDEYFNANLNRWEVPAGWKVVEQKLVLNGDSKLGTPKKFTYRDFDLYFTFNMKDGKGVAWALRVCDKGYYLFYLAGPTSKYKGQLLTFVCKNGKLDLSNPFNSVPTSVVVLTDKDFYTLRVKVRNNKMETFIKPETGKDVGVELPIGYFVDEDNLFVYGSIGFQAVEGESAVIDDIHVLPVDVEKEEKASAER